MTGKYEIEIYNNKVHYFLTIKRNITILQGNSATGKTELIRLISDHEENGASSGITVKCDVRCTVLTSVDWELRLKSLEKNIIFIDETASFLKTKKFAECVHGSDNYFVIITRDDLSQLPYSVEEIYGLRNEESKYRQYKRVYNEMYNLYNVTPMKKADPDVVICEDSNAGYEFFDIAYNGKCISAGGKSKVYKTIRTESNAHELLVIVDGAAFGSEMNKIHQYLRMGRVRCTLYAPESFEYLILRSGLIDIPGDVTEETWNHADSTEYLSWEEFYTAYLIQVAKGSQYRYKKNKLNEYYMSGIALQRILLSMPELIQP